MKEQERKARQISLFSFFLNLFLALVKILAGLLGNSYALVADGIESGMDVFSSLITYVGLRVASRPPDENHPYGHGKAETLATLVAASALVIAAVSISFQALREILNPGPVPELFTLPVLLLIILLKVVFAAMTLRVAKGLKSKALQAEGVHHGSDAVTSSLALIGISVAIFGGEDYVSADDWAAFLACFFILWQGLRMFHAGLHSFMDTETEPELKQALCEVALEHSEVRRIDLCRMRPSGYHYIVELHIQVSQELTVRAGHDIAHEVKEAVKAAEENVLEVIIHVEPFEAD